METRDVNLQAQTRPGPTGDMFVLMGCFGVLLITPAIGLLYEGPKRKKLADTFFQKYMTANCVIVLWFLLGNSVGSTPGSESKLIGGKTLEGAMPSVINFCFEMFFPVPTAQLILASVGERGRPLPSVIVGCIWVLLWNYGANHWSNLGLNFAGGGPARLASGVTMLVYSWYLGRRGKKVGKEKVTNDEDNSSFIGATLVCAAWLMFNASTLAFNGRTCYIILNTILAFFAHSAIDKLLTGKFSLQSACEGFVIGLLDITPSCGCYWPWAAFFTSIFTTTLCRSVARFGIDNHSLSFFLHGICGIIVDSFVGPKSAFSGEIADWTNEQCKQLVYQIGAWSSLLAWTGVVSLITLFIVDNIPGMQLEASTENEEKV
ncbi:putative ammonium transporter [Clavispora lusitaniae]|uniref:Ammonium transporter n=1 Tax=Clavispora lusitaniae TaxID=36911 RepID=A0AA91PUW9_CLALS|nr:putative ammonium transporter [Clavispora lusitaniae]